jgi:3-hydroxyacyl-CoA dehydrogenase / 3-hydroxy-2-methylbutyryl-CoA dehydrogenase
MRIEGAVGLVTGGASGLGEAVVRMLVASGARAAILDRPASDGGALADELGSAAEFFALDVRHPDEVEAAVRGAVMHFGHLDVTVNCAGVAPRADVLGHGGELHPLRTFRLAVDVNLVGLFDIVRWSAHFMSQNEAGVDGERGLIVNIASIAGYDGQVGQAAYTATKGAVIALTLQLARELATHGVRVMAIAPGMIDTPMLTAAPMQRRAALLDQHLFPRRLGRPEELARLVATFMETTFLNGEVVRLDAGARLGPGTRC